MTSCNHFWEEAGKNKDFFQIRNIFCYNRVQQGTSLCSVNNKSFWCKVRFYAKWGGLGLYKPNFIVYNKATQSRSASKRAEHGAVEIGVTMAVWGEGSGSCEEDAVPVNGSELISRTTDWQDRTVDWKLLLWNEIDHKARITVCWLPQQWALHRSELVTVRVRLP